MADNIIIEAKNITLNKNQKSSLFENEVKVKTKEGYIIKSDSADYNKETGILILKKNIIGYDDKKNTIKANFAKYNENTKVFFTIGPTEIITSENYTIEGSDITLNSSIKKIVVTILVQMIHFHVKMERNLNRSLSAKVCDLLQLFWSKNNTFAKK